MSRMDDWKRYSKGKQARKELKQYLENREMKKAVPVNQVSHRKQSASQKQVYNTPKRPKMLPAVIAVVILLCIGMIFGGHDDVSKQSPPDNVSAEMGAKEFVSTEPQQESDTQPNIDEEDQTEMTAMTPDTTELPSVNESANNEKPADNTEPVVQPHQPVNDTSQQDQSVVRSQPDNQTSGSNNAPSVSTGTSDRSNSSSNSSSGGGSSSGGVTVPAPEQGDNLVWVPVNGGTKYHSYSGCSKMKNPRQVSRETAEANGFTPCSKCW